MDDEFNEYNDPDATSCADGDYNAHEEAQLALDNEYDLHDDFVEEEHPDNDND